VPEPAEYSGVLTAVVMPKARRANCNADAFRKLMLTNFNMSLGQGLSKLSGWVFRIGHLGDFNDLTLMGTLAGRGDGPCSRSSAAGWAINSAPARP
jgi:alanine-glyoxylate transaminase/serine-glyoxylate transaminase/serine-pyruvate transaminase